MYRNYKIICITPAGRRRYMQYLVLQVITSEIVDRYDIWVNTLNKEDIYFFMKLAEKYPKVNLVWQPDGEVDGNRTINAFYRRCLDEDTIYFKLDDDIVWMEPSLIRKMADFRIDNPEYFLVSPLVINNTWCTYILEVKRRIKFSYYIPCNAHHIFWENGTFAFKLHDWFIRKWLVPGKWEELHCGKSEMGLTRFSINAVLWFGSQMKAFGGIIPEDPGDDEEFLSCIYPSSIGCSNCVNGDAIVSHFAFYTQRDRLDRESILDRYGKHLHEAWKKEDNLHETGLYIQGLMEEIRNKKDEISEMEIPYRTVLRKKKFRWVPFRDKLIQYITPAVHFDRIIKHKIDKQCRNLISED